MAKNNSTSGLFSNLEGVAPVTAPVVDEAPVAEVVEEPAAVEADDEDDLQIDELSMLKERAKLMGIKHPANISVDDLRAKVNGTLDGSIEEPKEEVAPVVQSEAPVKAQNVVPLTKAQQKSALRKAIVEENMKLVRVVVTNLDPKEQKLPGQIFTVANEYLGTVRKYVPYGEATQNGWHIPYCIYKLMKEMQFLLITTTVKNGKEVTEQRFTRKFSLEVLPPLTPKELATLQASQLASGAIDN